MSKKKILSFMKMAPDYCTVDLWCPLISGHWEKDNITGRIYADELLRHMRATQSPMLLGHVVKAMKGRHAGVEVGFFHRISEHLTS